METADLRVALSFHQGGLTNRKQVATEEVTTDVDAKMLHVSKSLYDSKELRAIRHLNNEARNHIRARSVPSYLRSGIYLVKLKFTQEIRDYLAANRPEWGKSPLHVAIQDFVAVLPKAEQDAKERLGKHYDAADYPTAAMVEAAFTWDFEWLSLEAPTELKKVSLAFYEEAEKKAKEQMRRVMEDIEQTLVQETVELLDSVVESLKPDADGKPKAFRAPVITKVEKFLDLLHYRDTGNEKLKEVTQQMRAAINGLSPKEVREGGRDGAVALAGRFDSMKQALSVLVTERPTRKIDLGDADAA